MLPDLVIAGVTILLSVAFATGWASLGFIFVVLLIRSAGAGVQSPAVQSFIPDVTPADRLLRVNSIFSVINSANMIVAPAVAAVLINVVPLWSILLVDVTTAVIGVGFVAMIRMPRRSGAVSAPEADAGVDAGGSVSLRASVGRTIADLRAGLRYVLGRPRLRSVILSDATVCLISVAPMNLTLLLMAREYEGVDLNLWFVNLTTASDKLAANELGWSIGMLLGGAIMSTIGARLVRNPMRVAAWGIAFYAVTVVGLGVAPGLLAYLVVDVLNGIASAVCMGPLRTVLQSESDESMVGRVFGLDTTMATFAMPIGMALFAPLADVIPIAIIFIVCGAATLPVGLWLLAQERRTASVAPEGCVA